MAESNRVDSRPAASPTAQSRTFLESPSANEAQSPKVNNATPRHAAEAEMSDSNDTPRAVPQNSSATTGLSENDSPLTVSPEPLAGDAAPQQQSKVAPSPQGDPAGFPLQQRSGDAPAVSSNAPVSSYAPNAQASQQPTPFAPTPTAPSAVAPSTGSSGATTSSSATPVPTMPAFMPFPTFAPMSKMPPAVGGIPGQLDGRVGGQPDQPSAGGQAHMSGVGASVQMTPFPPFFAPFMSAGQTFPSPAQSGSGNSSTEASEGSPMAQDQHLAAVQLPQPAQPAQSNPTGPAAQSQTPQGPPTGQSGQSGGQQPMYCFVPVPSGIPEAPFMYQCVPMPPGSSSPQNSIGPMSNGTMNSMQMPPMGPMGPSMLSMSTPQPQGQNGDDSGSGMKSIAATLAQMRDGDKRVVSVDVSAPRSFVPPDPNSPRTFLAAQRAYSSAAAQLRPHTCNMRDSWGRQCRRTFTRPYDLLRHQETVHSVGTKVYICERCGAGSKRFSRQDSLARHKRRMHHIEPEQRVSRFSMSGESPGYLESPPVSTAETQSEDERPEDEQPAGVRQVSVKEDTNFPKEKHLDQPAPGSDDTESDSSEPKRIKLDQRDMPLHQMENLVSPQAV